MGDVDVAMKGEGKNWAYATGDGINERMPNFVDKDGDFYLVRCFACAPERGRENYVLSVAMGQCAWCGAGRTE